MKRVISLIAALVLLMAVPAGATSFKGIQILDELGAPQGNKFADGKQRVSATPYTYDIAEGNLAGHVVVRRFGDDHTVGSSHTDIFGMEGTHDQVWLSAAETLKVVSADANDTSAGTGCRTVTVVGLDSNFDPLTETVTMNGTTQVSTTSSFLRVNEAYCATAGTSLWNEGQITVYDNAGTGPMAAMEAEHGHIYGPWYTVPEGKTLYLTHGYFFTDADKENHFDFCVNVPVASGGTGLWQCEMHVPIRQTSINLVFDMPMVLPEHTDLRLRAKTGTGTASMSAGWEGWIE